MTRNNTVFYVGFAAGSLHAHLYHLSLPMGLKLSIGLVLIGLGIFVAGKVRG